MTSYTQLSHTELERNLAELVDRLHAAVCSEPFSARPAAGVGTRLVELNCTGRTSLRCTLDMLGTALVAQPQLRRVNQVAKRVIVVLGALAADYAEAVRLSTAQRQKDIDSTLLTTLRTTQQQLEASEARFDELITCSASGIAITDLEGRFVRTNRALADFLGDPAGYPPKLFDLIHPADASALRDAYRQLLTGDAVLERLPRLRLASPDQTTTPVSCTVSLLRTSDGLPSRYVTMIDAITGADLHAPDAITDPDGPDGSDGPAGPGLPARLDLPDVPGLAQHEVHALSARNGPHFVYNLLTTISMFVRTDPARAQELLIDFADFTRYCCGAVDDYVTLGEELRNVDRYLTLEQARFGDRLQVNQQITAAVLAVRLPVLLVQGLVESAVRRGTEGNHSSGTVTISATDSDPDCLIVVEDDALVPDPPEPDGGGPTSLRNSGTELARIHDRLREAFGEHYQLVVDSTPETGTRISLRVPKTSGPPG